jgi:hypothetical protein
MTHLVGDPPLKKPPRRHSLPSRARAQQWWQDYRWFVLGGLWLAALALGYIGFARHFAALGETRSPLDLIYLTLQLFVLESGSIPGPKGWELELARLLAPGVAAFTAVQTLAVLFSEQLDLLRLRLARGHVVICGLGRKGYLLARGFRQRGDRVVVIEQDESNDLIAQCREWGATVLVGDATSEGALRQAQAHKASYVVSVCGDDGTNAEVAVRTREVVAILDDKALSCFVHIVEPQLCVLLREREIDMEKTGAFRLEFFNVFDRGARALLREYPPFGQAPDRAHLLVVGLGKMGENVVLQAARGWRADHAATRGPLPITIIDREAERKAGSLCARYPRLAEACSLVGLQMDVHSPEFQRGRFLFDANGRCQITAAYVCLDNDSLGLDAALTLLQQLRGQRTPIVVRMTHDAGLATLLRGAERGAGDFENLHAFGLLDRTCTPDLLLGGTHEIIAQAIHEEYVRYRTGLNQTTQIDPAMVPWQTLAEDLRESCRRQADHIGLKLKAIGCGIAPLTDWDAALLELTPPEVEQLARMEHERWMAERLGEGWSHGPRDLNRQANPYLVPWEQLPDEAKELNRDMARGLPAFLAKVGLQIYRLGRGSL